MEKKESGAKGKTESCNETLKSKKYDNRKKEREKEGKREGERKRSIQCLSKIVV